MEGRISDKGAVLDKVVGAARLGQFEDRGVGICLLMPDSGLREYRGGRQKDFLPDEAQHLH